MNQEINDRNKTDFHVGDKIRLLSVPRWLLNGPPEKCQAEILLCVGKVIEITEIDSFGYIWLEGEDLIEEKDNGVFYGRHSFCITQEHIEKVIISTPKSSEEIG